MDRTDAEDPLAVRREGTRPLVDAGRGGLLDRCRGTALTGADSFCACDRMPGHFPRGRTSLHSSSSGRSPPPLDLTKALDDKTIYPWQIHDAPGYSASVARPHKLIHQSPSCASACTTRIRICSDFIGNARQKSSRLSDAFRSRTFAVQ